MSNYIICARSIKKNAFGAEPGKPVFLECAEGSDITPQAKIPKKAWLEKVRDLADGQADNRISSVGDVLVFVHGYNNSLEEIRQRHEYLQQDLKAEGWRGVVVSFDWPSDTKLLNYYEDRSDAAATARYLVDNGIRLIMDGQKIGCQTNIHLLGHSTGAYVILESFDQSLRHGDMFKSNWRIGQVAFIGGDVSSDSIAASSQRAKPMFDRIMRLTNYQNGHDDVLGVSNAKRFGTAPRAGRVGLGETPHPKAINVDCSDYFASLDPKQETRRVGWWNHSWHIGNRVFARDLAMTMEGRIDRHYIPTRETRDGALYLRDGQRPAYEEHWLSLAESEGVPRFIGE